MCCSHLLVEITSIILQSQYRLSEKNKKSYKSISTFLHCNFLTIRKSYFKWMKKPVWYIRGIGLQFIFGNLLGKHSINVRNSFTLFNSCLSLIKTCTFYIMLIGRIFFVSFHERKFLTPTTTFNYRGLLLTSCTIYFIMVLTNNKDQFF